MGHHLSHVAVVALTLLLSGCWESERPLIPAKTAVSPVGDEPAFLWTLVGSDSEPQADILFLLVRQPGEEVAFDIIIPDEPQGTAVARMAPYGWGEGGDAVTGYIVELEMTEPTDQGVEHSVEFYWLQRGERGWHRYGSGLADKDPLRRPASYAALQNIIREEYQAGSLELYDVSTVYPLSAQAMAQFRAALGG